MADPTAREPIEDLVETLVSAAYHRDRDATAVHVRSARAALLSAISALRRDAERYQALREHPSIAAQFALECLGGNGDNAVRALDTFICEQTHISREAPHG